MEFHVAAAEQACWQHCGIYPCSLTLPLLVRNLLQRRKHPGHGERRGALQHGLVAPAGLRHVTNVSQLAVHLTAVQIQAVQGQCARTIRQVSCISILFVHINAICSCSK